MIVAEVLLVVGCAFVALAGIGVVRFPDVLARLHALGKASTLGIFLTCVGGAIALANPRDVLHLLLAGALQFLVVPVSTTLISRAAYGARSIALDLDAADELGQRDPGPHPEAEAEAEAEARVAETGAGGTPGKLAEPRDPDDR